MMFRCFVFVCAAVVAADLSAAPKTGELERLRTEVDELRMVVRTLRSDNQRLESRNERLMEDIRLLGRQIEAMRSTPVVSTAEPAAPEPVKEAGLPIVYVNAQMHIMIVEGSTDGLKVGDPGRVLREGGAVLGVVKISDIKPMQAVVDLDPASLAEGGLYPKVGDRVLLP